MIERVAVSPTVHFGKPCVAGTRITVESVLELIRDGVSFGDIIQDYFPDLDQQDIYACLEYAIDLVSAEDINLAPAAV